MVKDLYPSVTVIESDRNLGFGHVITGPFDETKGKYIFLNPDTVLLNDAVSILATYLDTTPSVALCGNLQTPTSTPTDPIVCSPILC